MGKLIIDIVQRLGVPYEYQRGWHRGINLAIGRPRMRTVIAEGTAELNFIAPYIKRRKCKKGGKLRRTILCLSAKAAGHNHHPNHGVTHHKNIRRNKKCILSNNVFKGAHIPEEASVTIDPHSYDQLLPASLIKLH